MLHSLHFLLEERKSFLMLFLLMQMVVPFVQFFSEFLNERIFLPSDGAKIIEILEVLLVWICLAGLLIGQGKSSLFLLKIVFELEPEFLLVELKLAEEMRSLLCLFPSKLGCWGLLLIGSIFYTLGLVMAKMRGGIAVVGFHVGWNYIKFITV